MSIPKKYTKNDFIKLLKSNSVDVNNELMESFVNDIPENIEHNGNLYNLNIIITINNNNNYSFELNYYCADVLEYLLPYKSIQDIDYALNRFITQTSELLK